MNSPRVIVGEGEFRYELIGSWGNFPDELVLGDVAAIAVDSRGQLYLFTRGEHPIIVANSDGDILRTWGHGLFANPHGLHLAADGNIYCTDDGDHTVRKFTPEGRLLLQLGIPGRPAPVMSNRPFNRCTHTALSPQGEIYVSDGYRNACIHKFTPDGRLLRTWGESGPAPGQFYFPHNLVCDPDGLVYVADRENHRIQVFDGDGKLEAQWRDLHRPCALCMGGAHDGLFYVGHLGTTMAFTAAYPNLGPRLTVLDAAGQQQASIDFGPPGVGPGRMIAPHGIAVDSRGDVYIGEVSHTAWAGTFPGQERPPRLPSLHKLRRIAPDQATLSSS
jgi:DNA-binding beta-propeller fold protein YncE